jgi:transposase InsO family protein
MVTPAAHREAAEYLQATYEMSQRRACRVIDTDRTSVRYQATRADDAALRERLRVLAQERRRFGYRRLHVLLRREGQVVNRKRVQRIYREERLTVRRRGGRKRAMGTRRPIEIPLIDRRPFHLACGAPGICSKIMKHRLLRRGEIAPPNLPQHAERPFDAGFGVRVARQIDELRHAIDGVDVGHSRHRRFDKAGDVTP